LSIHATLGHLNLLFCKFKDKIANGKKHKLGCQKSNTNNQFYNSKKAGTRIVPAFL